MEIDGVRNLAPETLSLQQDGPVLVVRLRRPPVNAVNRKMMSELRAVVAALAEDRSVNVAVLAAEGSRAFCGGVDVNEFSAGLPGTRSVSDTLDPGRYWRETFLQLRECSVPTIAAVERAAIGAGFGLVSACDIIVASESATFALKEIDVGLLGGAAQALRMVGPYKARMMLFSGQAVTAAELYRLGAVEALVGENEAEQTAFSIAAQLAVKSPIALRLAKESFLRVEGSALEDAYRTEQDYTRRLGSFDDSREAMTAFREKRTARWSWR